MTKPTDKPDVLMLLSTGCSHCPAVLTSLTELLKAGEIGRLEAINIQQRPDIAEQFHVRSVPWVKIGAIELIGAQSLSELKNAIALASSPSGLMSHYEELLNNGQLQEVQEQIQQQPEKLALLIEMLQVEDIKISVQIGIGAIMEAFAESAALTHLIPQLTELTSHPLARVRNDACFYLSLTASESVRETITSLLDDEDAEVRETAEDCLQELDDNLL